jgi:intracellular multiplication protein IcmJ
MATLYPIKLNAIADAWRLFSVRKSDVAFAEFGKRIFERDKYTCQYCGFQARQFQEIVNLDQNYHNNRITNLITACCFCTQCFFLESVGKDDYGGGVLIYLPEISQNDLNGFCHVLFCAMANATSYRTDAQNIYRSFKLRAQIVEKQLGDGMSDPALLGRMLIDAPERKRPKIEEEILSPLRLLPSHTRFTKQIDTWAKAALKELETKEK